MPVFDFSNSPSDKKEAICTYETFASNESVATEENPILVLDNSNTNMRDCFNYSLFPNLLQMSTIQQMYNLGDSVTITSGGATQTYQYGSTTDAVLDAATSAVRTGALSSNYLIQGYNTNCRPNSCKMSDIHLVVTPNTYVKMFSGMLSVLYNYGFQS